jgi:hypothetical protein
MLPTAIVSACGLCTSLCGATQPSLNKTVLLLCGWHGGTAAAGFALGGVVSRRYCQWCAERYFVSAMHVFAYVGSGSRGFVLAGMPAAQRPWGDLCNIHGRIPIQFLDEIWVPYHLFANNRLVDPPLISAGPCKPHYNKPYWPMG